MAITCVFGMTQSGKSFFVENTLLKTRPKKMIFDSARCFERGKFITPMVGGTDSQIEKEFKRLNQSEFSYIFRPGRLDNRVRAFDDLVRWASPLARVAGLRVEAEKRLLLVCDEADRIATPMIASKKLEWLVNEGRHDNIDSVFICRDPHALFIDARKNASTIVTFFQPLAGEMPFFKNLLGKDLTRKVSELPRYHYLTWKDSWDITITDENGNVYFKQGRK